MKVWLRTPRGVGVVVAAALTFAIGFVPLFAGPGYEHAIASGLIIPLIAALVAAAEGFAGRHAVAERAPHEIVARGLVTGLALSAAALGTAFVHVIFAGACDPLGGVATFALTAGAGALLAGGIGACVAIVTAHALSAARRRRRIAMLVAGLSPLASALAALAYFYFTPSVFAFDPFVGFFSGTLYDEVVDAWAPLLTYRAGTALTLAALVTASWSVVRETATAERGGDRLRVVRHRLAAVALLFAAGSTALIAYGPELGHRSSAGSIRAALGGVHHGRRCEVVHPRSITDLEAQLLVRDCDESIVAVEKRLGFAGPEKVTAFFFKDATQKRRLMGAAETYVAKPWRREVYLQVAPYPHPVLGHELAHVVAGSAAHGPFKVAGKVWGLFPNPGLIEGIAVAASPDRDELTPSQWASAMKRLEILPRLSKTFGGGFLAQNSSMAYTVAGSFVSFLYGEGKGAGVRAWYGGASFEQAFGMSFDAAEQAWRASLDGVPLPEAALLVAKGRFDRPAIWGRSCPHVVERLRDQADECREEGDLPRADQKLRALLELDVVDPSARLDRAKVALARNDDAAARALLDALATDTRVASSWRARAHKTLGDEALRHGGAGDAHLQEARAHYEAARREVLDDDWSRNLDVKVFATTSPLRAALFGRLLVGKGPRREGRDDSLAATLAIAKFLGNATESGAAPPEDVALGRYLIARRLVEAKIWEEAEPLLETLGKDDAQLLVSITPRLAREAARLGIAVACMADPALRPEKVRAALARFRAAPEGNAGRREAIERFAARCVTPS